MTRRMWMAVLVLIGLFIATYLAMYKLGFIGSLLCTVGNPCELVNSSTYARFLGVPVAVWGVGFYALLLLIVMVGIHERFAGSRSLAAGLVVLTGWGVLFSGYLTYRELFSIHAVCRWCVGSAVIATVVFGLAVGDWMGLRGEGKDVGAV